MPFCGSVCHAQLSLQAGLCLVWLVGLNFAAALFSLQAASLLMRDLPTLREDLELRKKAGQPRWSHSEETLGGIISDVSPFACLPFPSLPKKHASLRRLSQPFCTLGGMGSMLILCVFFSIKATAKTATTQGKGYLYTPSVSVRQALKGVRHMGGCSLHFALSGDLSLPARKRRTGLPTSFCTGTGGRQFRFPSALCMDGMPVWTPPGRGRSRQDRNWKPASPATTPPPCLHVEEEEYLTLCPHLPPPQPPLHTHACHFGKKKRTALKSMQGSCLRRGLSLHSPYTHCRLTCMHVCPI